LSEEKHQRAGVVSEIWRYIAVSAISVCVAFIIGNFVPNRNIVVKEDLTTAINAQKASTDQLVSSNDTLSNRLLSVELQLAAVNTKLSLPQPVIVPAKP
jgi:hypothetical protein